MGCIFDEHLNIEIQAQEYNMPEGIDGVDTTHSVWSYYASTCTYDTYSSQFVLNN